MKRKLKNLYDVAYKTKSGRLMVSKRVSAYTAKGAKALVKKEMKASTSFDRVVTAFKIN